MPSNTTKIGNEIILPIGLASPFGLNGLINEPVCKIKVLEHENV